MHAREMRCFWFPRAGARAGHLHRLSELRGHAAHAGEPVLGRSLLALPTVQQGVQRARDDEDAAHGDEQVEVKVPRLLDGEVDRRVAGCVGKARYRRVVVVQRRPARICVAAAPDLLELLAHLAAAVVHRAAPERLAGDRVPDRCVRLGRVRRRGGRRVEAGGGAQRPLLVRVRAGEGVLDLVPVRVRAAVSDRRRHHRHVPRSLEDEDLAVAVLGVAGLCPLPVVVPPRDERLHLPDAARGAQPSAAAVEIVAPRVREPVACEEEREEDAEESELERVPFGAPLKAARPLRRLCCGPRPSAGRGPRRRAAAAARRLVAEGERAGQQHVVLRRRLLPQESPQPAEHSAAGTLLVGARRGVGRRGVVEAATCHSAEGGGLRSGAEREPLWPLAVCEVDSQPSAFDVVAALHFAQWHLPISVAQRVDRDGERHGTRCQEALVDPH
mmetsp:Transcript_8244/g.24275  ORF Transcript_8244/g.24275 Transcript_8244/m.24275 type:complete len:443 (+) Transcript_8244:68-1396(+)